MNKQHDDMDGLPMELLQKYQAGRLTPEEQQQLAQLKAADPFLADALEGMAQLTGEHTLTKDVQELQRRLRRRTASSRTMVWSVAACVSLLMLCGMGLYRWLKPQAYEQAATIAAEAPADSGRHIMVQSAPVATIAALPPQRAAKEQPQLLKRTPVPVDQPAGLQPPAPMAEADKMIAPVETKEQLAVQELGLYQQAPIAMRAYPSAAKAEKPQKTIAGQVYAEDQLPMPGASIMVNNTSIGTISNIEGSFNLELPDSVQQLRINAIGYEPLVIDLSKQQQAETLQIYMQPDIQALSEVVVGYGSSKKERIAPVRAEARPAEGMDAFRHYIQQNLQYPAEARVRNIEGIVRVAFEVNMDSRLQNFRIQKSLGYGCDEEAIRLIKEGPVWEPATENGTSVTQQVTVKVKFKR